MREDTCDYKEIDEKYVKLYLSKIFLLLSNLKSRSTKNVKAEDWKILLDSIFYLMAMNSLFLKEKLVDVNALQYFVDFVYSFASGYLKGDENDTSKMEGINVKIFRTVLSGLIQMINVTTNLYQKICHW
jgi:hypothetical protein